MRRACTATPEGEGDDLAESDLDIGVLLAGLVGVLMVASSLFSVFFFLAWRLGFSRLRLRIARKYVTGSWIAHSYGSNSIVELVLHLNQED